MGQMIDNLIAARILWLLVKPFEKSDAFKLGIVNKDGKLLRKADELKSDEEKAAYNYLTRLVFNLKRLIGKIPGGKSMIASLVAAYFLIKEGIEHSDLTNLEEKFITLTTQMNEGLVLVEEQLLVEKFLAMMEDEGGGGIVAPSASGMSVVGTPTGPNDVAGTNLPLDVGVLKRRKRKIIPL